MAIAQEMSSTLIKNVCTFMHIRTIKCVCKCRGCGFRLSGKVRHYARPSLLIGTNIQSY